VHTGFWWGNLSERDHLEDLGVDGEIILKWILCFVDRASRYKFLVITNLTHFFMYLFISCLYKFRASQRSSSGDRIVLIHHLI